MMKRYLTTFLLALGLLVSSIAVGQSAASDPIAGLNIYPNPATQDVLYVQTTSQEEKQVAIYDVLGSRVLAVRLTGRRMDISSLSPGIYVVRIRQGENSASRKLVVR